MALKKGLNKAFSPVSEQIKLNHFKFDFDNSTFSTTLPENMTVKMFLNIFAKDLVSKKHKDVNGDFKDFRTISSGRYLPFQDIISKYTNNCEVVLSDFSRKGFRHRKINLDLDSKYHSTQLQNYLNSFISNSEETLSFNIKELKYMFNDVSHLEESKMFFILSSIFKNINSNLYCVNLKEVKLDDHEKPLFNINFVRNKEHPHNEIALTLCPAQSQSNFELSEFKSFNILRSLALKDNRHKIGIVTNFVKWKFHMYLINQDTSKVETINNFHFSKDYDFTVQCNVFQNRGLRLIVDVLNGISSEKEIKQII